MAMNLKNLVNSIQFPKNAKNATKNEEELKLEFITYENQVRGNAGVKKGLQAKDQELTLEITEVDQQVLRLEEQRSKMEAQSSNATVELLRGMTGLQKRQLDAFTKREEQSTVEAQEAVEILRASSGMGSRQLEAIRKAAQRQASEEQNQNEKNTQLSAKAVAARSRL